ncbi:myosin heavy chain [Tubulinosema ratisbonensis]|uniref:Myosin heavy chain n=1 Tax=Tubulinosema ratisbonensis TaxID=291195 RepID=A0A437APT0_9MICR|nr:myosin heavy chain [Tubulinosema ratisbonensis]
MFDQKELPLSQDTILKKLKENYQTKKIYTQCGIILLSINPFSELKMYDTNVMKAYYKNYGSVEPHVYSVSENAIQNLELNGNQTIIVSGESGSGKTINSQHILKYIIWRCNGTKHLEKLLLASHFILECFGNAKTQINENSSRYGKYLRLYFEDDKIVGGRINEYLLEKSRVTHQPERNLNFHIFYLVCSGTNTVFKNDYITTYDSPELKSKYKELKQMFKENNLISFDEISEKILAILKIGSIKFLEKNGKLELQDENLLREICKTFDLNYQTIKDSFLKSVLDCKIEAVNINNTKEKALNIRDTLARYLYTKVFNDVIGSLNNKLGVKTELTISILDIYGFEVFEQNGFDQFCINWANERIQNEFVKRMFTERQSFYKSENIPWPEVSFNSNDKIIGLLEGKLGIADLIDEESFNPVGSLQSLSVKLSKYNKSNPHFLDTCKPNCIKIDHFAYPVEYSLESFLEKNVENIKAFNFDKKESKKQSVIKYFISSMNELFNTINQTEIHYIRCIRPNIKKTAWLFDKDHISKQLKACGVRETINLSRLIYSYSIDKQSFTQRYRKILINTKEMAEKGLVEGKTKMFLKIETLKMLEEKRKEIIITSNEHLYKFFTSMILKNLVKKIDHSLKLKQSKPFIDDPIVKKEEFVKQINELNFQDGMSKQELQLEIERIRNHIKEIINFYDKPCKNCENTNLKYKFQSEELKKSKSLEEEIEKLKEINQKLTNEVKEHKELIKDMTILANEIRKEEGSLKIDDKDLLINLTNPHEVFSCLIEIYVENSPKFTNCTIPLDEMLSFGHLLFKIITELSQRDNTNYKTYLDIFLYELNENFVKFDTNLHKITFIFSNLLELNRLLDPTNELKSFTNSLFQHMCELQKEFISSFLPDAMIYHQPLDNFRCEDSFYKKYIKKPPSILKLVNQLEYLCSMMNYFGLPNAFVKESLRHLLKTINMICFNRILVEQNFLSFNRCTQINHNLNEISKFCQELGFLEGISALQHLKDVVILVFLLQNKETYQAIRAECKALNKIQLNGFFSKIKECKITFESENRGENGSLFLDEPELIFPDMTEKSNFTFCIPRFLPTKLITNLLSSI